MNGSPNVTRTVAGVDVTQLKSGAIQFACKAHSAVVTASLKAAGWKAFTTCGCKLEDLQPILDAIQAAQSNGHGKPAQTTSASEPALGNGNGKKPTAKALTSVRGSTLPYAIAYARRGIGVFPVHDIEGDWQCSCGKLECSSAGKHPRFSGWQESATTDEGQIREWWQQYPTANVGAKCGADSNLTVLDVDGDEGRETLHALELEHGELPETPVVITGSGGAHYYFAFEDGVRNLVRFAPGLDIRAEGGFVVGVGSKTKRSYEWEAAFALGNELLPARMPAWLADLIKGANASVNGNGRLTLPGKIPVGERNNWLYRLTRSLKARGMGANAIMLAVQSENSTRCAPPMPDDEVRQLVDHATTEPDQRGFAPPAVQNGAAVRTYHEVIVSEDYDAAVAANAEYLKRDHIIDRLFFSRTLSAFVGGKHNGKSTAARTSAMCVNRGVPFLGRAVKQGPVIYAASSDEVAVARMELLRMGWNSRKDALRLVHIKEEIDDPDEVLGSIGDLALREGAVYIVLDMLFDFAAIRDEMSYAGTRAAIGKIQALADRSLASVAPTHHSPKYMTDAITAAQAALGSQGIAARFSPIVLCRKWAEGLFTICSTTTRDPRGQALEEMCVEINSEGWMQAAGEFKSWMKWKIYASRVIALLEGDERGKEWSVDAVARGLDISRPDAQNALFRLAKDGQLEREKRGRGYRYWLPYQNEDVLKTTDEMFERKLQGESHE